MTRRGAFFLTLLVLVMPLAGLVVSWAGGWLVPKALPDLGTLPPFELVERTGRPITRDDLRGKVWVASFLFTRCSGQCPILTSKLRAIQKELRFKETFRLVSFTVDPEHDTPPVLRAYAAREEADPYKWLFVTGEKEKIELLASHGFRIAGGANHSAHFVLVDSAGHLRGYYDANDGEAMKRLLADARALLRRT